MDRLIYVAMNGAKHAMSKQAATSHNLANVSTDGFRAQYNTARAVAVIGPGQATRTFAVDSTVGTNFTPGPIDHTGRELDVAVEGRGWIAVQGADGREAYTRSGAFEVNANGQLQTKTGLNVIGDGGPIAIPPDARVTIARDGTVSTIPTIGIPNITNALGRIKLTDPDERELVRGDDGLFRLRNAPSAPPDLNVTLASGSLERSNVNAVSAITDIISQARMFEMQVRLLQNADQNARAASQLLNLNA
ncbi:MAG: flagellar basal body rod protein FlgF [Proteobacteria bacterium]|nr:flagellar basal body rod protein FlgF [Burkholderiales bacterium]